mmetsp:Transcript_72966/g.116377  ORF Transcript_72966/g.116377 Transcript_72966/m.116377 type:complete len:528 (+) Transcript_72966:3-1586(+)
MAEECCTGQNWVKSETAIIVAGIGSTIGLFIAGYNIVKHITYYTLPEQQLHIVRVLFIVPLYALVSFLSMLFTELALYFESVRDIYEAFVIYCFLILILGYVGGEANCVALISLKPDLKHPFPLCCLPRMSLNVRFLRFCKQSVIQFIMVKPIMAVLNIIMLATNNVNSVGYRIFSSAVYNICYTLALYGLLLFYLACKEDIRAYSPVRKFFAVKIVIFATYWQSLLVSVAPGLDKETADLWNDFILCVEMSVFACIHLYSFPWWEFRTGMPSSSELVAQNAKKVLSFKDVVRDVYHNVAPTYQTYVLQSQDGTVKEYKTKTYMVGNIDDPKVHNKFIPNFGGLREKYGANKNGSKFEKGFGQKKNYVAHTDEEESAFGPEVTETEIDYDPRMIHNGDDHDDEDESHDNEVDTQPEDDPNVLAVAGRHKGKKDKLRKTITPDYNHGDEIDEDEEEEDEQYELEIEHAEKGKNGSSMNSNGSSSKLTATPDSSTQLMLKQIDSLKKEDDDRHNDGDDEDNDDDEFDHV